MKKIIIIVVCMVIILLAPVVPAKLILGTRLEIPQSECSILNCYRGFTISQTVKILIDAQKHQAELNKNPQKLPGS